MSIWESAQGVELASIMMSYIPELADNMRALTEEIKELRKENAELKEAIIGITKEREEAEIERK